MRATRRLVLALAIAALGLLPGAERVALAHSHGLGHDGPALAGVLGGPAAPGIDAGGQCPSCTWAKSPGAGPGGASAALETSARTQDDAPPGTSWHPTCPDLTAGGPRAPPEAT
jgi:hypothetical protein